MKYSLIFLSDPVWFGIINVRGNLKPVDICDECPKSTGELKKKTLGKPSFALNQGHFMLGNTNEYTLFYAYLLGRNKEK